ncbi:MAG: cell division protein FtsH, partial [Mariprofundaceae bacterium]|nr:cell division protein FtsH [Mariprofundaceae bacterium]
AKDILIEHMDQLHLIALALIEYETLDGPEIDTIMAGNALHRGEPRQPKSPPQDPSEAAPETDTSVPSEEAGQHS